MLLAANGWEDGSMIVFLIVMAPVCLYAFISWLISVAKEAEEKEKRKTHFSNDVSAPRYVPAT